MVRTRRGNLVLGSVLAAAVLAVLSGTCATPASAQSILGVVREEGTGQPVAGALVRVLDMAGSPGGGTFLTASDGQYRVRLQAPGRYYLTVERIGYATTRVGPIDVGVDGPVTRDLTVKARAVELEGLTVRAEERDCDLSDGSGTAVQAAWSQVRKALTAATWTTHEGALDLRVRSWERHRRPGNLTILDEVPRTSRSSAGNSVRSLPAEELAAGGYVRAARDGSVEYYAPDAEAILSDAFLSRHCFSLRTEREGAADRVGLAFEPLPNQDTTDVSGVIWIHRGSGILDAVEFKYTGLSLDVGTQYAGGRVRYVELPDGRWIVADWYIRAPIVQVIRSTISVGTMSRQVLQSVYETGAEVLSARGSNFDWLPGRETAVLRGTVYDSTTTSPLAGAAVRVAGRAWRTRSDADGRFTLAELPVGRYRVVFEHPRLDSLGLTAQGADVELQAGSENEVVLAVASKATLLAETCPSGPDGALVGWLTEQGGERPVSGATVQVRGPDGVALASVQTGRDGAYRVCDLPVGTEVGVGATAGSFRSEEMRVRIAPEGYGRVDLSVRRGAARAADRSESIEVFGTVVDAQSKRPLPAATVAVVDEAGEPVATTVTDERGAFTLHVSGDEPKRVEVRSIGYGTATSEVLPRMRTRHRLEVELSPQAVDIPGMVVDVDGRDAVLDRHGFYDRSMSIQGTFIDREALAAGPTRRTSDALLRVAGVKSFSPFSSNTTRRWIQLRGAVRTSGFATCMPAVYVDGGLARAGKVLEGGGEDYPTLDELVSLQEIAGIELYDTPAAVPAQFTGPGTLCGAIVVWTR